MARGLGKGLDSLIPNAVGEAKVKKEAQQAVKEDKNAQETVVKITMVEPNRKQPRKNFDEDALQELADSIKQFGLIQPILVQDRKDHYEIIAGEKMACGQDIWIEGSTCAYPKLFGTGNHGNLSD